MEKRSIFECRYLSIGGDCMDKPDLNWEKCNGCEKTNDCEYCMFDGINGDMSFCGNCKVREDKND